MPSRFNIDLAIVDRHAGDDMYDDDDHPHADHKQRQREVNNYIIDFAKKHNSNKPLVVAMNVFGSNPDSVASAARLRRDFALAGVPAYSSPASAARALSRFVEYHQFQAKNRDSS